MERRTVLGLPLAALAGSAAFELASSPSQAQRNRAVSITDPSVKPVAVVMADHDRQGRTRQIGVSATTYKVVTSDTKGDLFVIEQANLRRGGPPLHVHHGEDELFYVLAGEYIVQIGDNKFPLKTGDCVLGPRGIPHAWAYVGSTAGRLLLSYAPAGKMEAFFNAWEQLGFSPGGYSKEKDAALLQSYGMERIGPPIQI